MKKNSLAWIIIAGMAVIIGSGCGGKQVTPVIVLTPTVTLTATSPNVQFGGSDTILVSLKNATSAEINGVTVSDGYKFIIPYFGSNLNGGDTTITCKATNAPAGGIPVSTNGTCSIHIYDYFYKYEQALCSKAWKLDSAKACAIADTAKPVSQRNWLYYASDCDVISFFLNYSSQITYGPCVVAPLIPGHTSTSGNWSFFLGPNGETFWDWSGNLSNVFTLFFLDDKSFVITQVKNGYYSIIYYSHTT